MAGGGITTAAGASPATKGGKGSPKTDGKPSDYAWCIGFAAAMYMGGKAMGWETSTPGENAAFLTTLNVLGFDTTPEEPMTWLPVFGV